MREKRYRHWTTTTSVTTDDVHSEWTDNERPGRQGAEAAEAHSAALACSSSVLRAIRKPRPRLSPISLPPRAGWAWTMASGQPSSSTPSSRASSRGKGRPSVHPLWDAPPEAPAYVIDIHDFIHTYTTSAAVQVGWVGRERWSLCLAVRGREQKVVGSLS